MLALQEGCSSPFNYCKGFPFIHCEGFLFHHCRRGPAHLEASHQPAVSTTKIASAEGAAAIAKIATAKVESRGIYAQ